MNRFLSTRYACSLVLSLGMLAAATSSAQAQGTPIKPKSKLPTKSVMKPLPYNMPIGSTTALNQGVLNFANSKLGQKIGSGECWDLANEALKAAGARQPGQNGYGSYVFGNEIPLKDLKRGDILQFEGVRFYHMYPDKSWYENKFDHHTAIVSQDLTYAQGKQIQLLHQNINGDKHVQKGVINLDHMQSGGTLKAYRPQPR